MVGLRPGRVLQHPAIPRAGKHLRQHEAFFWHHEQEDGNVLAAGASNTIRERSTTRNGRRRLRPSDSNTVRSPDSP